MGSATSKIAVKPKNKFHFEYGVEQILLAQKLRPLFSEPARILSLGPNRKDITAFKESPLFAQSRYTAVGVDEPLPVQTLKAPHRVLNLSLSSLYFSDQSFDFILGNESLPYIKSDFALIAEIHRCLRPDGVAMLGVPGIIEKTQRAREVKDSYPHLFRPGMEWIFGKDFFERIKAAGLFPLYLPRKGLILCFKYRGVREGVREILDE